LKRDEADLKFVFRAPFFSKATFDQFNGIFRHEASSCW
jgi:hypothetical protein